MLERWSKSYVSSLYINKGHNTCSNCATYKDVNYNEIPFLCIPSCLEAKVIAQGQPLYGTPVLKYIILNFGLQNHIVIHII